MQERLDPGEAAVTSCRKPCGRWSRRALCPTFLRGGRWCP